MNTTPDIPSKSPRKWGKFGEQVVGYSFEVFNEREVRASAGILFTLGFAGYITAITTSNTRFMQGFAVIFLFDMIIRLTVSPKYSPTMFLGRIAVYRQKPEWVSARPKRFAWGLGFVLALTTCFLMGRVGAPLPYIFAMCGVCMTVLFLETAFGICVGCILQQRITGKKPELCPGDSCNYSPNT